MNLAASIIWHPCERLMFALMFCAGAPPVCPTCPRSCAVSPDVLAGQRTAQISMDAKKKKIIRINKPNGACVAGGRDRGPGCERSSGRIILSRANLTFRRGNVLVRVQRHAPHHHCQGLAGR
jgi:hypothetical protein